MEICERRIRVIGRLIAVTIPPISQPCPATGWGVHDRKIGDRKMGMEKMGMAKMGRLVMCWLSTPFAGTGFDSDLD